MNLINQYLQAKQAEAEATARRVELGSQVATLLGAPTEGSATHKLDGYSVTVKQPVNRKVDWNVFDRVLAAHPDAAPPVAMKRELDLKGLRWTQENAPALYRELAQAITATPGRVQIEVKEVK